MPLLARLIQRLRWRLRLPELAEEIAERTFDQIWNRVGERVLQMSAAESRGYTRVLAQAEVARQVELTLMWLQLPRQWQPQLVALVTENAAARVVQRSQAAAAQAALRRVA